MPKKIDSQQVPLWPAAEWPMAEGDGDAPEVAPWRATLLDTARLAEVALEELEPLYFDLFRRNLEFLEALRLAGVPTRQRDVRDFEEWELPLFANLALMRQGLVTEDEVPDVLRVAVETTDTLAMIRHRILAGLAPHLRRRVQNEEARVKLSDEEVFRDLPPKIEPERLEEAHQIFGLGLLQLGIRNLPRGLLTPAHADLLLELTLEEWRREQEMRLLPSRLGLASLLKGLPVVWLDAVCAALEIDVDTAPRRRERERQIAATLLESPSLRRIVLDRLWPDERELLRDLIRQEGRASYTEVLTAYGNDRADGWFWNESPPGSVLGRLRLHGLAFVGVLAGSGWADRTVALPRELVEPLRAALEAEPPRRRCGSR
jgi:hypothetical protein